jgi:tRNA pseudouridine65 synthase
MRLAILHEEARWVAVDKPSGLSVHRGQGDRTVAMTVLRNQLGRWVYPVHRLDRATSGVLLFALDSEMAATLGDLFTRGAVEKTYLALCRGVPSSEGRIDHPVPNDENGERVGAITDYRRLWDNGGYALMLVSPRTGRYHQIRRHLKHLSHPLIGDVRYGKGDHNRKFRTEHALHRLALHAVSLAFSCAGTHVRINAPLPANLRDPLLTLGVPRELLERLTDTGSDREDRRS